MIREAVWGSFVGSLFHKINLVDGLNFIYFIIVGILILVFHGRIPHWSAIFCANTAWCLVIASLVWFVRKDSHPLFLFFRYMYTAAAIAFMYKETEFFMRIYHNGWLDPLITQFEISLLRMNPYLFLERISRPALNEYAKFAYSTYYFFLALMPLYFYFVKKREGFYHYMFTISLALFAGYLLFPVFPVQGPRYFWGPPIPGKHYVFALLRDPSVSFSIPELKGFLFDRLVGGVMKNMESTGACMPSTHVSASLVILAMIGRYIKPLFPAALPIIISVCLATVYNRYHYISDMLAGALVATVSILIGNRLFKKEKAFIK